MTSRTRKRDLRTRVTNLVHTRVKTFAAARQLTVYQATEHLVLAGLESTTNHATASDHATEALSQIAARLDAIAALTDCAALGAFTAYAYARYAALDSLSGDNRHNRDLALKESGQEALQRQRRRALEGQP